jgi:putative addiction module antidote
MTDETKKNRGVSDAERQPYDAETPAPKPAGRTLKVRKIGNSLGVVLPKEVLAHLKVGEGDALTVSDTPEGVQLTGFDDEVARQVEIMRDLAKRYRNALRELAK